MSSYLFGYGTLICSDARPELLDRRLGVSARLIGYERFWSSHSDGNVAPVGISQVHGKTSNGVIIPVTDDELALFDIREKSYERTRIPWSDIELLEGGEELDGVLWTYVVKNRVTVTKERPILQSYIDVVLTGCLEWGVDFATEFLATTSGWSKHWIHDRGNERYKRALKDLPQRELIDELIRETRKSL